MGGEMERSISSLCASLSSVLDHADSSSRELADAVSRRPIHLESATTAFLQKLDRLVEVANADLERLESMACGAVSFEELLGHCGEALNVYARHADVIESRLASFGYEPPNVEPEVDAEVLDGDIGELGDPANGCFGVSSSVLRSSRGRLSNEDHGLYPSLKSLGLSDACLATLSSEATDYVENPKELYKNPESADDSKKIMKEAEVIAPQSKRNDQDNSFKEVIRASKEEYEQLPPYMKSLASWEELQEGICKLNSYFGGAQGSVSLNQDDVGAIGLGRKGRACLLMLLRLNQLTMEAVNGSTFYTLRKNS
ncbi:unnamed protein product [Urochloa humidicola]